MPPASQGEVRAPAPPEPVSTGTGNGAVLVPALKAVVFLSNQNAVRPRGFESARGVVTDGLKVPSRKKFRPMVEKYIGKPVSLDSINRLTRDVILHYRQHDRPVVDVIVPEQDITSAVLQLVVLESRVGAVRAKGNRWFSSRLLESQMRVTADGPVSSSLVAADVKRLNENPFREVNLVYTPGKEFGATDLVLETKDRFPLRVYAGIENTGNTATGYNRWLAGFNWGNVWGAGHLLSYQFTTSPDFRSLLGNSVSYEAPLPWHHTLTLIAGYSRSVSQISEPVDSEGLSYQAGARYRIPLKPVGLWSHDLIAGFDFKRTNNNLEFGGTQVFGTNLDIIQWFAGYEAVESDEEGVTKLNITLTTSPGGLNGYNSNKAFQQARAGSDCSYEYLRTSVERTTKLPFGCSLGTRVLTQWAGTNLQAGEQFGLGGNGSVRGYHEGEVNGDSGMLFSAELRSPPFGLWQLAGRLRGRTGPEPDKPAVGDQLQFLCFWDYGIATIHHPTQDEPKQVNLSGAGLGLRYTVNTWIALRFDYGWPLINPGFNHTFAPQAYVGLVVSY